jgi:trk/ktr system potassium uptake protein
MAEFAIIGMGRFGRAVARSLSARGEMVLAIDKNAERLERIAAEVESVAQADTTEQQQLELLNLARMACVVVALGGCAPEASLLTTALLRLAGVPRVVARSFDDRNARLLLSVGAHEVINPEDEAGHGLAVRLARPAVRGQTSLGEMKVAVVESPEAFAGRTLQSLDLPTRFFVTALGLRRSGHNHAPLEPGETIESGDLLVLLGGEEAIARVAALR